MGYSVDEMNRDHDTLHARLCDWLGITSHSLMEARGEPLTPSQQELAWWEEDAVLHLQRLIARSGSTRWRGTDTP